MESETDKLTKRIVLLNQNLMSGVAIGNVARELGFRMDRIDSATSLAATIQGETESISLVVIDMNTDVDWTVVGELIKQSVDLPPIIGFGPHVDVDGRRAAKSAGLTRIYSNSDFHQKMGEIVRRHTSAPRTSSE